MSHTIRYILLGLGVLLLAGLVLPIVMRSRVASDRVSCQNHLRELGLIGVRHASPPGQGLPTRPRDELPPGTFLNPDLPPDQRMSWYAYLLNVLNDGAPNPDPAAKHRRPTGLADLLTEFDAKGKWDSPKNSVLADYKLTTAICPAQVPEFVAGRPINANYVAVGGLGLGTPAMSSDEAGRNAGAYRYDGPTDDSLFKDGLRQTAQIIETNLDTGPWLRGGPSTLRGLDVAAVPYTGIARPFGGCHPGGAYASMADGSVQFIKDTIEPGVFRTMFTRAGGPDEINPEAP